MRRNKRRSPFSKVWRMRYEITNLLTADFVYLHLPEGPRKQIKTVHITNEVHPVHLYF
jgi:hypothetical protein